MFRNLKYLCSISFLFCYSISELVISVKLNYYIAAIYLKNMLSLIAKEYLSDLRKTKSLFINFFNIFHFWMYFFFLIVMYGIK